MKPVDPERCRRLKFLFMALATVGIFLTGAGQRKISIVVKKDGALTQLSLKDIRAIYLGEMRYVGENKIIPLVNADDRVAREFYSTVLNKSADRYKLIWAEKALQDGVDPPPVYGQDPDILRMVASNDYAVGFVDAGNAVLSREVKVLNGKEAKTRDALAETRTVSTGVGEQSIAIVVKKDGALAQLSLKDIRAIYLGEMRYVGENKIFPLVNGDDRVAREFFSTVLNKSADKYKLIWAEKALQDGVDPPSVYGQDLDILRMVATNDYAVGFVNASSPFLSMEVKILPLGP